MWTKIVSFFLSNQKFILLFALMAAIGFGLYQYNNAQEYKADRERQKANVKAIQDTVGYYRNKADELTAEKLALQTDKKQLKEVNKDLSEELEKEQDEVEYLARINARLKADTAVADTVEIIETQPGSYKFNWNLSRQGEGWQRVLEGYMTMKLNSAGVPYDPNFVILKDILDLEIVTGITKKGNKRRIFIRSTYPALNVTDIEGAILHTEDVNSPSRFGIGPAIGAGYTTSGSVVPFVGISLNYNLISF